MVLVIYFKKLSMVYAVELLGRKHLQRSVVSSPAMHGAAAIN